MVNRTPALTLKYNRRRSETLPTSRIELAKSVVHYVWINLNAMKLS